MNIRQRISIMGLGLTIVVVSTAVAFAGHQASGVSSFTGCLKQSNGTLSRFAVGDSPQSPCPSGNVEMHVSGGDITSVATPAGSGLQGGGTDGAVSLSLATVPAARAFASSPVDIDNVGDEESLQIVPFDAETFDTANLHSTTTDTGRLTAPRDGIYVVTGNVEWCNSTDGFREATILLGANGVMAQSRIDAVTDGLHTSQSLSAILDLASGAYVQLALRQGSSGNLCTLGTTEGNPSLSMVWIGPG
jgi:hypothetical protein